MDPPNNDDQVTKSSGQLEVNEPISPQIEEQLVNIQPDVSSAEQQAQEPAAAVIEPAIVADIIEQKDPNEQKEWVINSIDYCIYLELNFSTNRIERFEPYSIIILIQICYNSVMTFQYRRNV